MSEQSSPTHPGDGLDPTAAPREADPGRPEPPHDDGFAEPEGYVGESFPTYSPTRPSAPLVPVEQPVPAEQSVPAERSDTAGRSDAAATPPINYALQTRLARAAIWLGPLALIGLFVALMTGHYWLPFVCILPLLIVCTVAAANLKNRHPS